MSDDNQQTQGKPDAGERAASGSPDAPPRQPDQGQDPGEEPRRQNEDKNPGGDGFEPEATPGTTLPGYGDA